MCCLRRAIYYYAFIGHCKASYSESGEIDLCLRSSNFNYLLSIMAESGFAAALKDCL